MREDLFEEATEIGRSWAERVADSLADSVPASSWPVSWQPAWARDLPTNGKLNEDDQQRLWVYAHEVAAEHWLDLVRARRHAEDNEDEVHDAETHALALAESIRPGLPAGLQVVVDGPRVFILDVRTQAERPVTSLEAAWRVTDEWREHHS